MLDEPDDAVCPSAGATAIPAPISARPVQIQARRRIALTCPLSALARILALPQEDPLPVCVVEGGGRKAGRRSHESRDVLVRIGVAGIWERKLAEEGPRRRARVVGVHADERDALAVPGRQALQEGELPAARLAP